DFDWERARVRAVFLARFEDDRFVFGPAHAPAVLDLAQLAGLGSKGPLHYAATIAHVSCGRKRHIRQRLDSDVVILANGELIFDAALDREVMPVAQCDFEFALVSL